MEDTPQEAIPTFTPPTRKINKRFIYLVLVIIILFLTFLAYKTLGSKNKGAISQNPAVSTPTPTQVQSVLPSGSPTPSPTNTPTPKPTINPVDSSTGLDRSKLSVTIQNGSGQAGVAGKASDILKNLGYNVVATGNADNFNYSNVSIQVKASDSNYLSLLQKDLGFNYTIGSTSADLSDGFSSNALVIIGQ